MVDLEYTPLCKYYRSVKVVEALDHALGQIMDIGHDYYGDERIKKLYHDLEDLSYEYDKYHKVLYEEYIYWEKEEASNDEEA